MKYLGVTQGCRKRGAGLEPNNFHLYKQNTQKNQKSAKAIQIYSDFNEDLSWHEHIDKMISKINQRLGVLRRIKDFLDLDAHYILYTSLILLLFDYADTIWGDKKNSVLTDSL